MVAMTWVKTGFMGGEYVQVMKMENGGQESQGLTGEPPPSLQGSMQLGFQTQSAKLLLSEDAWLHPPAERLSFH